MRTHGACEARELERLALVAAAVVLHRRAPVLTCERVRLAGRGMCEVPMLDDLAGLFHEVVEAGHQAEQGDEQEQGAEEAAKHEARR